MFIGYEWQHETCSILILPIMSWLPSIMYIWYVIFIDILSDKNDVTLHTKMWLIIQRYYLFFYGILCFNEQKWKTFLFLNIIIGIFWSSCHRCSIWRIRFYMNRPCIKMEIPSPHNWWKITMKFSSDLLLLFPFCKHKRIEFIRE